MITEKLQNWINTNHLTISELDNNGSDIVVVNDKRYLYLKPTDGKVIDEDFAFILSDEEFDLLESKEVDYILFEFGERFYYSELKKDKNRYNEEIYKPQFNDFKYLGENSEDDIIPNFAHLGIHSEYEIMNGSADPSVWVQKAKFLRCSAIGICDKNTLSGTLPFQTACEKKGIKSIIGETISVVVDYTGEEMQEKFELILYVTNLVGWKNLLQINRCINVEHNKFVTEEELFRYSEGLICVIAKNSYLNYHKEDRKRCYETILKYKKQFKSGLYYQIDTVEYSGAHSFQSHLENIDFYMRYYSKLLPPILINDSYYLDKEQSILKGTLNKIAGVVNPESEDQFFKSINESILSYEEWYEEVGSLLDLILKSAKNAIKMSNGVEFRIPTNERKLPEYKTKDVKKLFYDEVEKGFQEHFGYLTKQEQEKYRLELLKEFNVIVPNGLCDYFMILWDIINWCRENEIMVGVGRGSVCGSLVAYCLNITAVDPLKYNLMFERFLNETRVSGERAKSADSMPDIDCDFPTEYRDIVKEYIAARYGRNHTCSIGTYTRLKLKTCIKDFAKLKGLSFDYTNKLTKNIDDQVEYTWGDLIEYACNSKMLFEFVQQYPEIVHLTKYALLQPKTESVHPSAVVIVPDKDSSGNSVDLYGWLPIKQIDGLLVSEWEGKYIDKSGFLKEDILGLSQLDKFSSMLKLIKKNCGKWIDVNKIPFDDQEVFKYFRRGWCEDVFQFGSNGLMNYCRQAKPNTLEDLIAMNALFRPGPMDIGAHQDFVDFKNGKKKPQFDYGMEEVTKETFSLYVYQEQIMKAVVVAGLSQVQSDVLRTTIKKKDFNTLNGFRGQFIEGYVKLLQKGNIKDPEKYADKVWNKLLSFAGYGFNKCLDEDECILKFGYNDGMYVPTIGEMYKIMHMSAKEAKECGHASLRKKYNKSGYGMCLSLSKDNKRIKKNKIVDITPSGFRKVYNVTTETGRNIRVTMNHKFPTPNGEKMLCELKVGDVLYCIGDYEITPYIKTGGNSGNFPKKGQSGFQKKVGYVRTNLFKDFRKKHIGCSCEICGRKYDEDSRFEVHHRNKNRNNNLERNLIWLCNSCHKKIHYEELNRVKVGEKGYFVNQEKIISIDYCGYKQTYNVEVSGDVSHTFLNFEGIVTSNSHAAAYTIMGYWSQWFKVNYPLEFWTTSLQFATEAEVPYRLAEMKKTGVDIEIRPPDVNYSEKNFTCDAGEQRIFFSINKIKQVGDVAVENILKTREEGGRFFSLEEFCSRVPKKVNKRIIVHLIIAGAFDMIEDIRNPRERRKLLQQYLESKGDKLPEAYRGEEAQTNAFWILEQKKLTGFGEIDYESMIRESIPNKRVAKMYVNDIEFLGAKENDEVTIAGRLMYYHENETKNGTMCGMQIDCNNTIIYFTAWPDFYKDIKDEIEDIKGCLIAVCGTVKKDKFKGDKRVYSNNGTRLFIINSKID